MPFISDAQVAKLQSFASASKSRIAKAKERAQEKAGEVKSTLECVGAAGLMGYVRGKREDAAGVWNAPFVKFDMELMVGLTTVGCAYFDLFGKYDEDVLMAGNGILAHYTGQVMRKMAKTGSFSMVAGSRHHTIGQLNEGYADPHADPVAAALARSGV
jgi:hypothetical protein